MGFFPICDPHDFFKNRALSLLYPYGALTICKKLEKSLEQSLTDGPTDGLTTADIGDYIRSEMEFEEQHYFKTRVQLCLKDETL